MKKKERPVVASMNQLIEMVKGQKKVALEKIFKLLANKGYATLLIIFSIPFCFPMQIPGSSTPFGLIMALVGIRMAFSHKVWWPKWILKKEVSAVHVRSFAKKVIWANEKLATLICPRLPLLVNSAFFSCFNGILVAIDSLILAIPLPIPFSNMVAAVPVFLIAIGLIEEDGGAILLSYFVSILCFFTYGALFFLGKTYLASLFS